MSVNNVPLQVVPDVDDEESADNPQPPTSTPPGSSDFELKLKEAVQKDNASQGPKKLVIGRRRAPGTPPPIRRLCQDAQPLSAEGYRQHRHLFPQ